MGRLTLQNGLQALGSSVLLSTENTTIRMLAQRVRALHLHEKPRTSEGHHADYY